MNRSESITIPSAGPEIPAGKVFTPHQPKAGRKQAKTLEKTSTVVSDQIKSFHLFEQGLNTLEVMDKLNMEVNQIYSKIQLRTS